LDQAEHAHCLKRGGNIDFVPFDTKFAEHRYQLGQPDVLTADKIFDARWAMTLLDAAMTRLAQQYAAQGKTSVFQTLKPFLDPINGTVSLSYEEVANVMGVTVGAVKTLIHRLRKQYSCLLREEVGRTVADPAEIDEEIHALCEALIATEGRLVS
jgi:RNA polymerase sigma-70 factor (ECF subfamily)